MSGNPSVITLCYGKFTCSFTRTEEAEALTSAIMGQIADIVHDNPSFGSAAPAEAAPQTAPSPVARDAASGAQPSQNSFDAEEPDFDSAVSFMRSPNANATDADPEARLLARYDALRGAVIKMLSDASDALEALEPIQAAPQTNAISEPRAEEGPEEPVDTVEDDIPFDPFPYRMEDDVPETAKEEHHAEPAPAAEHAMPSLRNFDQQADMGAISAELAPDNETTVYRLIPTI